MSEKKEVVDERAVVEVVREDERERGFFGRLFKRLDESLKQKAEEKAGGGCCGGDSRGGKCC